MQQPLVAVSADTKQFENYTWHAVPDQYVEAALSVADVLPVIVPAFGTRLDIDALLGSVHGLILTGSKSNVRPDNYGGEANEEHGPYDPARDATTLPLVHAAIERGIPLLAICRGFQELNVALGGTLTPEVQELEGRDDHRAPESDDQDSRFAIRQSVEIRPGSCLAGIFGAGEVMVNSLHRQAIDRPASNLVVEAVAGDGTVEGASVRGARTFAVGVQWHPEYWAASDETSAKIFRAFGEAVHAHAAARAAAKTAAE